MTHVRVRPEWRRIYPGLPDRVYRVIPAGEGNPWIRIQGEGIGHGFHPDELTVCPDHFEAVAGAEPPRDA